MSTYRDNYIARGIPAFDPNASSPYAKGKVPRAAWWWIEPSSTIKMPHPMQVDRDDDDRDEVIELIDEVCIKMLCENFDEAANGGNGELINQDHLARISGNSTVADGWVRALDWGINPATGTPYLAGYLDLTPDGYDHILNYYWAWSTEYLMSEYIDRGNGNWSPSRLRGLAPTNIPAHPNQVSSIQPGEASRDYITHSKGFIIHHRSHQPKNKPKNMTKKYNQFERVLHSGDPVSEQKKEEEQVKTNADAEKQPSEEVKTNSDDENTDDINCNSDDEGWVDIANQIATLLILGEEASGDDIVDAVKALKEDNDALRAASSASEGMNQNSRKQAPRVLHSANKQEQRLDKQVNPSPSKTVRTADGKEVKVNSRELDLVTHCRKQVDAYRATLGRELTSGEFDREWARSAKSFNQQ